MAYSFNLSGATPGTPNQGTQTSTPMMAGTSASRALNTASAPNFSTIGLSPGVAMGMGLTPKSQTLTYPDGTKHTMSYQPPSPNAPKTTTPVAQGTTAPPAPSTTSVLNVPNPQGGFVSGTPQGVADALSGANKQVAPAPQTAAPASTPNATYQGLINQSAQSATGSPFVTQEQKLLGQEQSLAGQLAPALATVTNTPGLLANQNARAANVTSAYGQEMQGLGSALTGATSAQTAQQQGLLGAGGLASPANAIVTPPAGGISTNVLTGQQYTAPIYEPAAGAYQPLSAQPGGTPGQPATAGQASQYTIQTGDTFNALAAKYGTTAAALEAANPGANPNDLKVGSQITIPSGGTATPFEGGQAGAQATLGEQYTANNAAISAAQGIQQKIVQDITTSGIDSLSSINKINAINQWIQGNLSNPAYQNFYQDLTDYTQTIAPLIGVSGTMTDMKTAIGQSLISSTSSGSTIEQGLQNLNALAINKNNAIAAAGQGALPAGQSGASGTTGGSGATSGATQTYTAADGNSYSMYQDANGNWVVK